MKSKMLYSNFLSEAPEAVKAYGLGSQESLQSKSCIIFGQEAFKMV